jgi:hypothetical protein
MQNARLMRAFLLEFSNSSELHTNFERMIAI